MLLVMLVRCFFVLVLQFLVLLRRILNDQVLRLDLTRRVMDHVFDDELSVTEFADAASQRVILTWCLFCSEQPGLLHAVLAAGLATEVTVGILQLFLILPGMLTCVTSRRVLVVSLADWFVHEEDCFKFIEDMLALADDENATRFEELVNSVTPVISRLLLKLIVDSDALPE